MPLAATGRLKALRFTFGDVEASQELSVEWQSLKQLMEQIVEDPIADFNSAYKSSGLPVVIIPAR